MKHPIQPIDFDENGTLRFKKNAIVDFLLEKGGYDMNKLATIEFSNEDREQFAQLIGYSLSGFAELSYVSNETYAAASAIHKYGLTAQEARIAYLSTTLESVKSALKQCVPQNFSIHEDDLK